ncbi:ATP-binding protein [Actinoplanes solisilvae]|uniref:ATP-binding protein n=1 Tax=Actinoplanes solisilvae TaxID=2486853 RepID=UPI0013E3E8E0|nr:LuxR family transcriptional regulator [Actinoplanes solisilvae]
MIGRERQLSVLLGLLDQAAGGTAATVVVRGEAGIGKSTLVGHLEKAAAAAGFATLVTAGVQSEASIGMAGLHQLLHGAVGRIDRLPLQQADALRSAFGLGPDVAPDRHLLSVAVLGLLEELAAERPLLLVLEDVHWMDEWTVGIIGFVAQHLDEAPILIVATVRDGAVDPLAALNLPGLALGRLSDTDAARLLTGLDPALGRPARDRILAEAEGNPLALVELTRGVTDGGLAEAIALPARLPLTSRLEQAFAASVERLPRPTQDLLLIAAASSEPWIREIEAAANRLDLGLADLAPAEQAGLVRTTGHELRFRHPLVLSAVYNAAGRPRRARAHLALAEALSGEADQPRAAWHRASAASGTHEEIAADLDRAAVTLMAQGNGGSAMRTWKRAAELTPAGTTRAHRLARAADAARQAGLDAAALQLAADATVTSDNPAVLVRAGLVESNLGLTTGGINRDPLDLGSIARRAGATATSPEERLTALTLLIATAIRCAATSAAPAVRGLVEQDLRALPYAAGTVWDAVIGALLNPSRHGQSAAELLRAAPDPVTAMSAHCMALACHMPHDWALAVRLQSISADLARRTGAAGTLAASLTSLGQAYATQGHLDDALATADEGRRLAADLHQPLTQSMAGAIVAHVHAWRGDTAAMTAALESSRAVDPNGRVDIGLWQQWSTGLAHLVGGRLWEARAHLAGVCDLPGLGLVAIADLAEASGRDSDTGALAERLDAAEEHARSFDSPLIRMLLPRARALISVEPEELFEASLAVVGAHDYPLQVARTELVYGEWLRRRRRIAEARTHLTVAAAAFRRAGARPWTERAEAELRSTGLEVSPDAGPRHKDLTAQELQIARLAAQGLSNKEIADQLFLSHRTVGTHLYRIYPKLGVAGRAALRDALTE